MNPTILTLNYAACMLAIALSISPKGDSSRRVVNYYQVECSGDTEFAVEIWDEKNVVVRSPFTLSKMQDGVCLGRFGWQTSARITKGYLPINKSFRWRAVFRDGKYTEFYAFRAVPIYYENFSKSFGETKLSDPSDWKLTNGHAVTTTVGKEALLVTDFDPKKAFKSEGLGYSYYGVDTRFTINPVCEPDTCELSLRFEGGRYRCDSSGCYQSWYSDLYISSDGVTRLRRLEWQQATSSYQVKKSVELSSAVVYFGEQQTIRITRMSDRRTLLISTINGNDCVPFEDNGSSSLQAGVGWKSREDDVGHSSLAVDVIAVAAAARIDDCDFPLPPL
jgi:hypothetical protein